MTDPSIPVFVIAQQRSGTNLLRKSLAATGLFQDEDEIFDPRKPGFWQYYQNSVQINPDYVVPLSDRKLELFEDYLQTTLENSNRRFVLLMSSITQQATSIRSGIPLSTCLDSSCG